ncbi:MAG: hypothetical protein J0I48_01880 [Devosia sp.]|uniref:hypothetical protein n=1 Tax=Devosia sp. 66-22 TaxID=1895753 RepID=UPI000A789A6F|nr:hypothetical protein [Devosia sp. 66-22]MBN9344938.1 hypothetical protein [Devosia sp.]
MSPPRKAPPKKRNLAAKALRSPLFRPKVAGNPAAYKRRKRFIRNPGDDTSDDQIN